MKVGIHYKKASNPRLAYTLAFIQDHPLNPELILNLNERGECNLFYDSEGSSNGYDFIIPESNQFFTSNHINTKSLVANTYQWKNINYYSVEEKTTSSQAILKDNVFQFDIFEMIFFHISRYEEVFCSSEEHNEWDTMVEHNQFLVKNKLEKKPIVDQLVRLFFSLISKTTIVKKSNYTISHDIDHIQKFTSPFSILKKIPGHLYRRKTVKKLPLLISEYYSTIGNIEKDPYNNFDWLLCDKEHLTKEIYFLIAGNHSVDTPISLDNKLFRSAIQKAKDRGYTVGIHPSYLSWRNQQEIVKQKQALESITHSNVTISRQHYLHFDLQKTPYILSKAGIEEDSSLGYNRYIGFRCGTGFPYYLYDFKNEKRFSILEKPLAFMDSSCWHESGKNKQKFIQLFTNFFHQNQYDSHISTNFHNSFFNEATFNNIDFKSMYLNLLESI